MAVYLITAHAYRSWREDHPLGYVQRGEGLKEASEELARWRAARAKGEETRFEEEAQHALHEMAIAIAKEQAVRLHACATCPTHVHVLISFGSPACECGVSKHCRRGCAARTRAEEIVARMKRKMGLAVAKREGTRGKKWFSRGWDLSPVRKRDHFDYLVEVYLPDHQETQAGVYRRYP